MISVARSMSSSRARRMLMVIVAAAVLLSLLAASLEVSVFADHECVCDCATGGDPCTCGGCRICLLISVASYIMRAAAFAAVCLYTLLQVCRLSVHAAEIFACLPARSPITLKVKLLN